MYAPEFGVSVMFRRETPPAEYLEKLRGFGFTALELHAPYLDRHERELREVAPELSSLVYHLPHDAEHHVLSPSAAVDDAAFERFRRHVGRATEIGVRTFVLHLMNVGGQRLEEYWDRSVDFARRMGDMVAGHGSVVGVENCYPVVANGPVARRFLDEVAHPAVGLNLDAGHFWSPMCEDEYGRHREDPLLRTPEGEEVLNRRLLEMVREAGRRTVNIHVHNIRPGDWLDHRPVDSGVIEYGPFFDALEGIGYDRTVIVEIRPTPEGDGWSGFESSARFLRSFMPGGER